MKIGVTAASGKLGQLILAELAASIGAANVVGIARTPEKIGIDGIETRTADYSDTAVWPEVLEGIDTVVLISSPAGTGDRVQMHWNVIEGGALAGVRKMLYTSVIGDGKEADTRYAPFAAINRQTEVALQASGLEWVVPRNGLYLEFDVAHIVNADKDNGIYRNNGGDGRCGYITRDEIAFATAKLALDESANGKIFNLVGDCHTQAELVAMVNEVFGTNVRYEAFSDEECFAKLEPVRGQIVASMLTGCYQCIRNGAYDVPSDFFAAAGRAAKPVKEQIATIKATLRLRE
jgi:NAD(P)H dehydrogenase (quinone)